MALFRYILDSNYDSVDTMDVYLQTEIICSILFKLSFLPTAFLIIALRTLKYVIVMQLISREMQIGRAHV